MLALTDMRLFPIDHAPNFCSSECAGRASVAIRSPRRRIAERLRLGERGIRMKVE
jgi:hypothetical protein